MTEPEIVAANPRIQPKAQGVIELASDEPIRTANVEGSAMGGTPLPLPTAKNTKQEIVHYLMYEHGIDPDDLDMLKADLLELAYDLDRVS